MFTACQMPPIPGEAPKPDVELPSSKANSNIPLKSDLNTKSPQHWLANTLAPKPFNQTPASDLQGDN